MKKIVLCVLFLCFARISYSAEAPIVVIKHVPPGWVTESEGYFLNAEALSSLAASASMHRQQADTWEGAYYELSEKSEKYAGDMKKSLAELRGQLDEERAAWKSAVRRARYPGFGVFAGAGYTGSGIEAVIGVGVVWRLF